MSLNNSILQSLHFERLNRMNNKTDTKCESNNHENSNDGDDLCCAVCYTNDKSSGLVIPKNCIHKICLVCYSNLLLQNSSSAKCPECRAMYLNKSDLIVDTSNINVYDDLPDLKPINTEPLTNVPLNIRHISATERNNQTYYRFSQDEINTYWNTIIDYILEPLNNRQNINIDEHNDNRVTH